MARTRSNPTTSQTNEGETRVMASTAVTELSAEDIAGLLANTKSRGDYKRELGSFIDSGARGVQVSLDSGTFANKKPQSVKTGLENARKAKDAPEAATNVRVILHEDKVYMIRTDVEAAEAA